MLTLLLVACTPGSNPAAPGQQPLITGVRAPEPIMLGSRILVEGNNLDRLGRSAELRVLPFNANRQEVALTPPSDSEPDPDSDSDPQPRRAPEGQRVFEVSAELVDRLGQGTHEVDLIVRGNHVQSPKKAHRFRIAKRLTLRVEDMPRGEVHFNEEAVIRGGGFLSEGEGTVTAEFNGQYTIEETGDDHGVQTTLPVRPAERFARNRAVLVLSPDIAASIRPGTFEGQVTLRSETRSGMQSATEPMRTTLHFGKPQLASFEPQELRIEQRLRIHGAGFVGDETRGTVLELDGTFQPRDGEPQSFNEAILPQFEAGNELVYPVKSEVVQGIRTPKLISKLFGARQGHFEGQARVVISSGSQEVASEPMEVELTLAQVKQVVWLRFLPGFYDVLPKFGLAAAADVIEDRVAERIESIFDDWLIDIRLERPTDYSENGFAILDVSGPPPGDLGLRGFDATPGRDSGNVRLYDRIGGENAETQADGCLGYGGVFVENFLWYSEHPGLRRRRPKIKLDDGTLKPSPEPHPKFDEIFDPVRDNPATVAEVRGDAGSYRVDAVERAIRTFANMVGTTTAHELGHSLGLANPYRAPSACTQENGNFHNFNDGTGCLMDSGGNIPFEERASLPGAPRTRLCNNHPSYLDRIHGPR